MIKKKKSKLGTSTERHPLHPKAIPKIIKETGVTVKTEELFDDPTSKAAEEAAQEIKKELSELKKMIEVVEATPVEEEPPEEKAKKVKRDKTSSEDKITSGGSKVTEGMITVKDLADEFKTTGQKLRKKLRKKFAKGDGRWCWTEEEANEIRKYLKS
jgi:hypothetical protein